MGFLCAECYNNFINGGEEKRKYILSKKIHVCSCCGASKRCVLYERLLFNEWLINFFHYRTRALLMKIKKFYRDRYK